MAAGLAEVHNKVLSGEAGYCPAYPARFANDERPGVVTAGYPISGPVCCEIADPARVTQLRHLTGDEPADHSILAANAAAVSFPARVVRVGGEVDDCQASRNPPGTRHIAAASQRRLKWAGSS